MEIGVSELIGDRSKYYMNVKMKISKIEGKTCLTSFDGYGCVREHLLRMVRKRNKKIEGVFDVPTKDGWILRIKPWTVLNGNPPSGVGNKMRGFMKNFLNEFASKNSIGEIVRKIVSTELQMRIKKEGSKIYPVRFSEIARIKVLRSPEFKAASPRPEKREEEKSKPEEKPKTEVKIQEKPIEQPKEEKPEKPEEKEVRSPEKKEEKPKAEKKTEKPKKPKKAAKEKKTVKKTVKKAAKKGTTKKAKKK